MGCKVTPEPGYLRAELFDCGTTKEASAFFRAIARETRTHPRPCILVSVRCSRLNLHFDLREFVELLVQLAAWEPTHRVALVGDSEEHHRSLEHVALLARQRGYNVHASKTEALALYWLTDRRQLKDRRTGQEPHWNQVSLQREEMRRSERRQQG